MFYRLTRRLFWTLGPKATQSLALRCINPLVQLGLVGSNDINDAPMHLAKMRFPNGVGLASHFDVNGEAVTSLARSGLGFIEVGPVTFYAQASAKTNTQYLLPNELGIIRRMHNTNDGALALKKRLKSGAAFRLRGGRLGIALTPHQATPIENYGDELVQLMDTLVEEADYFTLELSSSAHHCVWLDTHLVPLLSQVAQARTRLLERKLDRVLPVFVKLPLALTDDTLMRVVHRVEEAGLDGFIAFMGTDQREAQPRVDKHHYESGILVGAPIKQTVKQRLGQLTFYAKPTSTIIASGGMVSEQDIIDAMDLGAHAVQLFSGLYLEGPQLIQEALQVVKAYPDRG